MYLWVSLAWILYLWVSVTRILYLWVSLAWICICEWVWHEFCICEWAWHEFMYLWVSLSRILYLWVSLAWIHVFVSEPGMNFIFVSEPGMHFVFVSEPGKKSVFLYLVIFTWDDDDVLFVQEHRSMGRHATSLRHIILSPSHQVLAVALNTARLNREAAHVNIIVHGLIWPRLEHTIYHRGGEHANHFTTDFIILYLKSTTWLYCYFL